MGWASSYTSSRTRKKTFRAHWWDTTGPTRVHCSEGGFTSRTAAETYAADREAEIRAGTSLDPRAGRQTVAELAQLWLDGATVEAATLYRRQSYLNTHILPAFGHLQVRALKPSRIRVFVRSLRETGYAPHTIADIMQMLRQVLDLAVADKVIADNPARGLKLPRRQRVTSKPALTERQAQVFVAAFEDFWQPMLRAAFGTGLRWGELTGLRRSRVDVLHSTVQVVSGDVLSRVGSRLVRAQGKTAAAVRTLDHLDAATMAAFTVALERPGRPEDSVFRGIKGTLLNEPTWNSDVWATTRAVLTERLARRLDPNAAEHERLVRLTTVPDKRGKLRMAPARLAAWRARVDALLEGVAADEVAELLGKLPAYTPHCTRHTHATWLVAAGVDLAEMMRRMGWSTLRSAQPYIQAERAAAAAAGAAIGERMAIVAAAPPATPPPAGDNVRRLPAVGG